MTIGQCYLCFRIISAASFISNSSATMSTTIHFTQVHTNIKREKYELKVVVSTVAENEKTHHSPYIQ